MLNLSTASNLFIKQGVNAKIFFSKVKFSIYLFDNTYTQQHMMSNGIDETFSMSAKVPSCSREITTIS